MCTSLQENCARGNISIEWCYLIPCTILGARQLNNIAEPEAIQEKKCTILQLNCNAKSIINVAFSNSALIAIRRHKSKEFVASELGAVQDCYIAENSKFSKKLS